MRFALIDAKKADIAVETACAVLNVSVSGYLRLENSASELPPTARSALARPYPRPVFVSRARPMAALRMHAELQEAGLCAGRHRVARIMRENHLKARQKTRFKKTTDSDHGGLSRPNVLDQNFAAEEPDQKWGVDISYVCTTATRS